MSSEKETLYQEWFQAAYDSQGVSIKKFWSGYMPLETRIYKDLLEGQAPFVHEGGKGKLNIPLLEFAEKYGLRPEYAVGFLDGISGALDENIDVETMASDSVMDITVDFDKLYRKMIEFKAKHLYTLPGWEKFFSEEEREKMADEQRRSGTVVLGERPGRNDPCTCGSGKKYKKCCGAAS